MERRRIGLAIVMVVVGAVQSWDSRVLEAGTPFVALAFFAIVAPALTLLATRDLRVYGAVLLSALVALMVAKFTAPIELPALGVALFPAAFPFLFHRLLELKAQAA